MVWADPPVIVPKGKIVGVFHKYCVPIGASAGTISKAVPLQTVTSLGVIVGLGLTVTTNLNGGAAQFPALGVIM